jgi:hypothetical protein
MHATANSDQRRPEQNGQDCSGFIVREGEINGDLHLPQRHRGAETVQMPKETVLRRMCTTW